MTRFAKNSFPNSEIWGCDVSAEHIFFAKKSIQDAKFFVNTFHGGMPFNDYFFDVIFCGSVFTHLDELFDMWLYELLRIISKNGILVITLNDENVLRKLKTNNTNNQFEEAVKKVQSMDLDDNFMQATIERRDGLYTFINSKYFKSLIKGFANIEHISDMTYGYQQTYFLKRL